MVLLLGGSALYPRTQELKYMKMICSKIIW